MTTPADRKDVINLLSERRHLPVHVRDMIFRFHANDVNVRDVSGNRYVTEGLSTRLRKFISDTGVKNCIIIDLSYEWSGSWNVEIFNQYFDMLEAHIGMKVYVITLNHKICSDERYIYYNQFWYTRYYTRDHSDNLTIPLDKQYTMLYQNGRTDMQKMCMINILHSKGLLDDAVWSAIKYHPRISKKYASVELNKQLPKAFDVSNRGKCFWLSFYPELYKLTRFSLIAETQMHNKACRYSEKTVKAILNKHPFIICGYYKTLELLRDDGFRTFEGIIDESYDNILDWQERQAAIADEVAKLVNMSDDTWLSFQHDIQSIINHNFNRLVELSSVKGLELSHVINTIYDMS